MLAVHPVSAQMARENRQFLGRAVRYVAARDIGQFIDVGAGLPTALNTHDIARQVNADARVAYVANDPAVVPGSYLIISVGSGSRSEGKNFTSAYTAARLYIHSIEEVSTFFDGLELVPPGVGSVRSWYGDEEALPVEPRSATLICGVARKP